MSLHARLAAVKRWATGAVEAALLGVLRALPAVSRLRIGRRLSVVQRLDYPGRELWMYCDSELEYSLRAFSCRKEPQTVTWLDTFVGPGDVLYDIGANVGAYTLVAAARVGATGHVYAFEPAFMNFHQLCRNVFLNRLDTNVTPLPAALSDTTGLGRFNYRDLTVGAALHAYGVAMDEHGRAFTPAQTQALLGYRLDDLVAVFGLRPPTHLKLDVDGIEALVLRGARDTLTKAPVRSVLVELVEGTSGEAETKALLTELGFAVHARERFDMRRSGEAPGVAYNYVFVRG